MMKDRTCHVLAALAIGIYVALLMLCVFLLYYIHIQMLQNREACLKTQQKPSVRMHPFQHSLPPPFENMRKRNKGLEKFFC